jgi:UDP-glucose 4-epimerase
VNTRKILVTGGAGYIGSHTVRLLLDQGYDVVVYDSLHAGHPEAVERLQRAFPQRSIRLVRGDIGDRAAVQGGPPLTVFGDDYPTPDGTCIRDFVHVSDLADVHVAALRALEAGGASSSYNLGNGEGMSVRQVLDSVGRTTGTPVPHTIGPRRAGDPARLVASSARARRDFNWTPKYAALDTIVATAWEWHRRHPRGYASGDPA